jgi:hypothetical protein
MWLLKSRECAYVEIPIPKVDSCSYVGERRYLAHSFSTSTSMHCMYYAAAAVGANLTNPLPDIAGDLCVDMQRASSMNFEVYIVEHFLM